jgi:hypothetical protein
MLGGEGKGAGIGVVRENDSDTGRETPLLGGAKEGAAVGTASGGENTDDRLRGWHR